MKIFKFTILLLTAALCINAVAAPAKKNTGNAKKTVKKAAKPGAGKKSPPASVNISAFAPDAKDATAALQKAIKTRAGKIIFDRAQKYYLRPVTLRNNQQIIFNDGAVIIGLPQLKNSKGKKLPALFNGTRIKNVTFKGNGKIEISVPENMQIFNFISSRALNFRDLTISGGAAAVYLNNCWGAKVIDLVIDGTTSGIIVEHGGWNNITNTQFRNIKSCAFTVIGNRFADLPNLTLDNCEFFNGNTSFVLAMPAAVVLRKTPPAKPPRPARINLRSCRFFNNSGVDMRLAGQLINGIVRLDNCVLSNTANTSLVLHNFSALPQNIKLEVNNTQFRPGDHNPKPPITVISELLQKTGNVKFINSAVSLPVHKKAIIFDLKKRSLSFEGVLPVISVDGSRKNAPLAMEEK